MAAWQCVARSRKGIDVFFSLGNSLGYRHIPIILANQGAPWTRNVKIPDAKFINDVNYRCCLRSRISLYEGSSSLLPVQEFVSIFYNLIHTELHVFHF